MNIIKQKLIKFSGKTFSDHKGFRIELEKAFEAIQDQTIKTMMVEEREIRCDWFNRDARLIRNKDLGFNQCCAIQRENEKKIKNL